MDFLLVLIELFSLGVTAEALRAISLQRGPVEAKFRVEGFAPTTNHSSSQITRLNDLSRGIKYGQIVSVCHNTRV